MQISKFMNYYIPYIIYFLSLLKPISTIPRYMFTIFNYLSVQLNQLQIFINAKTILNNVLNTKQLYVEHFLNIILSTEDKILFTHS